MQKTHLNYQQNNLKMILEYMGIKLNNSPGRAFPFRNDFYQKLGISNQRFKQLVLNDPKKDSIRFEEIGVLADHFGCDKDILTADKISIEDLKFKIEVNETA